jgi:O-antigen/teichoic acid export membrane protein
VSREPEESASSDRRSSRTTSAFSRGLTIILSRSIGIQIVSAGALVYVVHVLGARDLGILAVGGLVPGFLDLVAGSGLVAGLLRRPQEPTVAEIGTTVSFAVLGTLISVGVMLSLLGLDPRLVWVMVLTTLAYGVDATRIPASVRLERRLQFGHISVGALIESAVGSLVGVILVAEHGGVVGFALGGLVGSVLGGAYILAVSSANRVRPHWKPSSLKDVLSFGLRFQAVHGTSVARSQVMSYVLLAVGGTPLLGYVTFVTRVCGPVLLLLNSVWEITYPFMAKAVRLGQDLSSELRQGMELTAMASAVLVGCMAGVSRVWIPVIFGRGWDIVLPGFPYCCLGLAVLGPLTIAVPGGLLTLGRARSVVTAMIAQALISLPLFPVLYGPLGFTGIMVATMLGSLAEAAVVAQACASTLGIPVFTLTGRSVLLTVLTGAPGMVFAYANGGTSWADFVIVALVVLAAAAIATPLIFRNSFLSTIAYARNALRRRRTDPGMGSTT